MKLTIVLAITLLTPTLLFSQRADTTAALQKLQRFFHNIPIKSDYYGWVSYIENDDSYKFDSTSMGSVYLKLTDKLFNPFNILDLQYEYVIERVIMRDTLKNVTLDTVEAIYMVAIFPDNKKAVPQIKKIVRAFKKEFRPLFQTKQPQHYEYKGHGLTSFSLYLGPTDNSSFITIYYSYSVNFKKYYLAIELTRMQDYKLQRDYAKMYEEK